MARVIQSPGVEINEKRRPCKKTYWWIDNPVMVHMVVAIIVAPIGVVPGKRP